MADSPSHSLSLVVVVGTAWGDGVPAECEVLSLAVSTVEDETAFVADRSIPGGTTGEVEDSMPTSTTLIVEGTMINKGLAAALQSNSKVPFHSRAA
jgi:hypothetical protein